MNDIIGLANELRRRNFIDWRQFHYCQAWTSQLLQARYHLIKSYGTIVGIADTDSYKVYEFGKYSSTTSKQFTRICNEKFRGYTRVFINQTNW